MASLYSFRGDHTSAMEVARQLLAVAERTGDPAIRVEAQLFLGTGAAFTSRIDDGIPELEASVAWWQAHPYESTHHRLGPDPRVSTLTALSLLGWWQGRLDTSLRRSLETLDLAHRLGHPSTSGYALHHASLLRLWRGEPAAARELAVQVIELSDEHEMHIWNAVGTVVLGAAAVSLGIVDEGLRWIAEGLERYRGLRTPPVFWPFMLQLRAEACRQAGETRSGLEAAGEALALAPELPEVHLVSGDLWLQAGDVDAATSAWQAAAGGAHRWGASTSELRALVRLCRLDGASSAGRDERLAALRAVVGTFSEGLDSPDLVAAQVVLAES
jgi:hypothetical protein